MKNISVSDEVYKFFESKAVEMNTSPDRLINLTLEGALSTWKLIDVVGLALSDDDGKIH